MSQTTALIIVLATSVAIAILCTITVWVLTDGLKPRPHCQSCQTLVWPWTKSCPNCGAPLLYCLGPKGVEHSPDATYCHDCGRHLREAQ